tara:strand:- start:2292 stop:2615 length:324 start_codon:yes stop_codon:yes gene_type:complete
MIKSHIDDMVGGWFIGDFEPSILKTKDFEVGVLSHKKGEDWPTHYHKEITEYNVLVSGKMIIAGETLSSGDIFVIAPNEIADPEFLEDCTVVVVKTPSVIGDKYEVL